MRIDEKRGELWVTGWSDGEIWRHDLKDGSLKQRLTVGAHAADQLWHAPTGRLFLAAANTNTVAVLAFNKADRLEVIERINVAMTPRQPVGMTPSALAFSPDLTKLYVACSDANAVAVIDIQQESRVLGYVPTGWYPTEVVARADGSLAILNGKGLRSHPNPKGPREQYVGRIQTGTVSIVPALNAETLAAHTKQTFENTPYRDEKLDRAMVPAGNPVPAKPGDPSPIKHVIYVVKENRTYDQVFGDLKEGNGEPSLVMFGPDASANHRKLAREFTLLDNFYVSGDVSADGHQWSAAAIAPDYTQKLWPNMYAGRGGQFSLYWGRPPQGESEIATLPAGGYLWTKAFEAGRTVRNYGWFVKNTPVAAPNGGKQILSAESPKLDSVTSRTFRGYDLDYKDVDRMTHFLADLKEWETKGEMPQLTVMRLGNDHTSGGRGGSPTPLAMFADNDLALGRMVEALSKSRFWKDTAVFVLEDDAQSGPDHIDSHRSIAFVISAYSKRKAVDSTMYNTTSMLRTMELILGLAPMTHFDAAATPMAGCFQNKPDLTPYQAVVPRQPLDQLNPRGTPLARRSERLDFREADRIPDEELNEILWLALKGDREPMPAPARSRFSALR
jgi:DNA-binding beta-propeller fold protein YncE